MTSLVPANVIGGFKTCGIYPFDPKAVIDRPREQEIPQTSGIYSTTASVLVQSNPVNSDVAQAAFTEEEICFARCYSKGYYLESDPRYLQ